MKYQITVHFNDGHEPITGIPDEMDGGEVKNMVDRLMQAEAQGSLVVETINPTGWGVVPTRSISYVQITEVGEDES